MPRVDTTRETNSEKLPHLSERRTHLRQECQSKLAWVASRRSDLIGEDEDGELWIRSDVYMIAGTADREMEVTISKIRRHEKELADLELKIAHIQRLLEWFVDESPAPPRVD
jgi:hypothetical protein